MCFAWYQKRIALENIVSIMYKVYWPVYTVRKMETPRILSLKMWQEKFSGLFSLIIKKKGRKQANVSKCSTIEDIKTDEKKNLEKWD